MNPLLPVLASLLLAAGPAATAAQLRVATFNASLNDDKGQLAERLLSGNDQAARDTAAILQRVRPDIVLLNEFDHDPQGLAAERFRRLYLERSQAGDAPLHYPYLFLAPVNTGEPSGLDVDGDGRIEGPNDAWGFGRHPGQYGMLLLSRYPIDTGKARTFRLLRWSELPGALRPYHPDGRPVHDDATWRKLRLSSKSHWDVPVQTPLGTLHVLAAHPTPPIFDGPEDLNGRRNHDELRLWKLYLDDERLDWPCDDQGRCGGLPGEAAFVALGDFNADPLDGDARPGAAQQITHHPRARPYPPPRSSGAQAAAGALPGCTDPATHTGAFQPAGRNLRIDYVVPSRAFEVVASGVFWPLPGEAEAVWLRSSDHRLVWVDLRPASD
ncbi:MAG: endonuclease [Lysobacteraceae bacterium]|nr:MAG: endonuclease [Xanthomonadaceae bacterium]